MEDLDDLLGDMMEEQPKKRRGRPPKKAQEEKPEAKAPETKEEDNAGKPTPVTSARRKGSMHDPRKLTKKGQESLRKKWSNTASSSSRHDMMASLVSAARDKFGVNRVFASHDELAQLSIGIPMPSLAMEYVMANDIFPLGSVVMLAGSWGAGKSTLSYEIFRWFYELSGITFHVDTETKFDYEWCCDVMRIPKDIRESDYTPIISSRADSLEQMQSMTTHYLKSAQKTLVGTKDAPGPGKSVPCCFAIDSLAAAASEELQEKILKEGYANRAHPINALKNTHYLQSIKKQFDGWPFTLLVVNHMKEKMDDMGNKQQYTLGGQSYNFHESFELRVSNWKRKINTASFNGIGVRIECAKNSFGPTGRRIRTRLLNWFETDAETGETERMVVWDWNWAICTLLNEVTGQEKTRLKERGIDIKCKSPSADVECLANLTALGMGKDEYLPFTDVGQMIHESPEVSEAIRDALNIQRRHHLDRPYDEIVADHVGGIK